MKQPDKEKEPIEVRDARKQKRYVSVLPTTANKKRD